MIRISDIFENVKGLIVKLRCKGKSTVLEEEFIGYEAFSSQHQPKSYKVNRMSVSFMGEDAEKND